MRVPICLLVCVVLWLLGGGSVGFAQTESVTFDHLTQEDGLSNNAIRTIFQDRKGFIWIGTEDGLNRYDGVQFRVYRHQPNDPGSVPGSTVLTIYEDRAGTLWFGTLSNGLGRYDSATDTFKTYPYQVAGELTKNFETPLCLYEDSSGNFWAGTVGGLLLFDRATGKFTGYPSPSQITSSITSMVEDQQGNLWAIVGFEIWVFDLTKRQFTERVYETTTRSPRAILNSCLRLHPNGTVFALMSQEFLIFDPGRRKLIESCTRLIGDTPLENDWAFMSLQFADNFSAWVAVSGGGLMWVDLRAKSAVLYRYDATVATSLSGSHPLALWLDQSGVLWIGDLASGISKYSRYKNKFRLYRHNPFDPTSISNNYIRGMCEDHTGKLWVATQFGGLNVLDQQTGKFQKYPGYSDDGKSNVSSEMWAVIQDHAHRLWVGGNAGLHFFSSDQKTISPFRLPGFPGLIVHTLTEDRKQQIWVGTSDGVFLISADRQSASRPVFQSDWATADIGNDVQSIYEDQAGEIWIGTTIGFLRWNPGTNRAMFFSRPFSDQTNKEATVCYFFEDHAGTLWLATKGAGICRFDRQHNSFAQITETEGLPHNNTYAIFEDRDRKFWMSSDAGIIQFDPQANTFKTFGPTDGLQGKEFNRHAHCQTASGKIFFGGPNGLNSFEPVRVVTNPLPPPVRITSVRIGEVTHILDAWALSPELKLDYRQNSLTFEFAALDFHAPDKNQFAYQLEGFHHDWVTAGNTHTATFTNLPAGQYRFRVKGSNNDGVWNETGSFVTIRLGAPPWKTWWAYGLYSLVAVGGLAVAFQYQRTSIVAHAKVREAKLQTELIEVRANGLEKENLQRMYAEAEIRRKNTELEDANLKLKELDRLKASFAAMLVHDLKAPLTVVRTSLDLLETDQIFSESSASGFIGTSKNNIDQMLSLINELLELYRSESPERKIDFKPIDLNSLLLKCLMSAKLASQSKSLEVDLISPMALPATLADGKQLERVFSNLLSNAIKYTEPGGAITIEPSVVWGVGVETGTEWIRVTITDTGNGIPAEELPYLFDPYRQVETQNSKPGVGLGLAIVKRIVAAHGGNVSVRSQVGVGSAFTVMLPVTPVIHSERERSLKPEGSVSSASDVSADHNRESVQLKGRRILLVDDNHLNLKITKTLLQRLGCEVEVADSGVKAVTLALEQSFDLVLMDSHMPEMDGLTATQAIRRQEGPQRRVPIIALTASSPQDRERCLAAGMDDFLEKPMTVEKIEMLFQRWVELADSSTPAD